MAGLIIDLRVGAMYRSFNKPMRRVIESMPFKTGIQYITYRECCYTEKSKWRFVGEPKTVLRSTFLGWLTSEVKEVKI